MVDSRRVALTGEGDTCSLPVLANWDGDDVMTDKIVGNERNTSKENEFI